MRKTLVVFLLSLFIFLMLVPIIKHNLITLAKETYGSTELDTENLLFLNQLGRSGFGDQFSDATDDVIPPNITHIAVTKAIEGREILIGAYITDNVAVKGATLHYRKTGDSFYVNINMNSYLGCAECPSLMLSHYSFIPSSAVTTAGVEYYISATDGINIATHPATNAETNPHRVLVEDMSAHAHVTIFPWMLLTAVTIIVVLMLSVMKKFLGIKRACWRRNTKIFPDKNAHAWDVNVENL